MINIIDNSVGRYKYRSCHLNPEEYKMKVWNTSYPEPFDFHRVFKNMFVNAGLSQFRELSMVNLWISGPIGYL
jgi:hypothetical protein